MYNYEFLGVIFLFCFGVGGLLIVFSVEEKVESVGK